MNDQVTPLAALSAQMAPDVSTLSDFECCRRAMELALTARPPDIGIPLKPITLEATNWNELHAELASLRDDAGHIAWVLTSFCRSVLPLTSHPKSVS